MHSWEIMLESLRQEGWGYGYGKCHDPETRREVFLVNVGRGSKRLSIAKPTIEEAVTAIRILAQAAS